MTSICALMAFYDDPPDAIERAIRSVEGLATHLVAVDGAYASFPGGEAHSHAELPERIREAAFAIGIDLLLYMPEDVWVGGEPEKRDRMFRMGDATGADWFTVLDSDFRFTYPEGQNAVFEVLDGALGFEVGEVELIDYLTNAETNERERIVSKLPLFYRAAGYAPIRVGPTHYHTRREGSGTHLWGCANTPRVPWFDMTGVVSVEHEWWHRDDNRQIRKWTYYFQRDQAELEKNPFSPALVAAMAEEE